MLTPIFNNPILNPDFWLSLRALQDVFVLGAGLRGELGQRYLTWLMLTPLYLLATFAGGCLGAVVWLGATGIAAHEAVAVFGITRPYARLLYALIPLTLYIAVAQPQLFAALPVLALLLPGVVAILASRSGPVSEAQAQAAQTSRAYLYVVWSLAACRRAENGNAQVGVNWTDGSEVQNSRLRGGIGGTSVTERMCAGRTLGPVCG